MAIPPTFEPIGQVLTPDEYDALPEHSRRELVDGVVHLMATPTPWHQHIADGLTLALRRSAPPRFRVTRQIEVRVDDLTRRNPDVLVVRSAGFDLRVPRLRPDQVVLAVEVVDRGSETADRIAKPEQYARAGIPHYWRIETETDVGVYTYRLVDGPEYAHMGTFAKGDTTMAPGLEWAAVSVSDLSKED
ncbi:MAG TPA: Uma2 family endonuclease [Jiangellaceae bacterium]|nr:Uma2 family endonuclease [Jiangellaceae bacterium]